MLLNEFFPDKETLAKHPLQTRMLYQIIAYKANYIFAQTVIDVLVKRNPNYRDDPNAKCQVDHFVADRDTAFEGKYHLEGLYESEYGEISDELKESIKIVAQEFANIPLVKFGWIKEETKCT